MKTDLGKRSWYQKQPSSIQSSTIENIVSSEVAAKCQKVFSNKCKLWDGTK